MPSSQLAPIAGDPLAVAAAARTFDSIAAEVAAASAKLRALATGSADWRGHASSQASIRSATLPPKLDKVQRSYATAGTALRMYASALDDAQRRSQAAVRAAATANADLAAARAQRQSAAASDAAQAAAAAAAGLPTPQPTALRYNAEISDAETRVARAVRANDEAHDDQQRAARTVAARLHEASSEGIKNQPWWRHVASSAANWASVAWHDGLRVVSRVATAISALAGLAALVVAIAGIAFPPLEAAAAVLETISVVSGVVGTAADAAMAASGDGSWTTVAADALMFAPAVGASGVRRLPLLRRAISRRIGARTQAEALRLRRTTTLKALADSHQPPRQGSPLTVAVLETRSGASYSGRSGFRRPLQPELKDALDAVPDEMRSRFHGRCAEIDCLNQALTTGSDVRGSLISTARVRGVSSPGHGTPIEPCSSCASVLEALGGSYGPC